MKYARISGSGGFLPDRIVSNSDLAEDLASRNVWTSDRWIIERTGIQQRHLAFPGTKSSQLAVRAAELALDDANMKPECIDLIIVATSTPDCILPSTACLVQSELGARRSIAFDVQAACSGFIYALVVAESFICSGKICNSLIIGAEVFSKILDWNDRSTCVLFGDGAGAVVLNASKECGILGTDLMSNGDQSGILCASGSISNGSVVGCPFLRMEGRSVFKQAILVLERSARLVCKKSGIKIENIDWLVLHQANIRIINFVARKLGFSMEKVIITLDKHANTSAASVPLAFDIARKDGRIKTGNVVLMQGVGSGLTWGSVLIRV